MGKCKFYFLRLTTLPRILFTLIQYFMLMRFEKKKIKQNEPKANPNCRQKFIYQLNRLRDGLTQSNEIKIVLTF